MAGLTFVGLVNAVLANAFAESHRTNAKRWVNARHAKLVDLEEWNFKYAVSTVSVTSGSNNVGSVPADLSVVLSMQKSDGTILVPIEDVRAFQARYYDADVAITGSPEAFCMVGGVLKVGPASNVTSAAYELTYQRGATEMTADSDVPIIPWQYHSTLVSGAKAEGMRELGIPLWGEYEEAWSQDIQAMRRSYLTTVRTSGEAFSGQFVPGWA